MLTADKSVTRNLKSLKRNGKEGNKRKNGQQKKPQTLNSKLRTFQCKNGFNQHCQEEGKRKKETNAERKERIKR